MLRVTWHYNLKRASTKRLRKRSWRTIVFVSSSPAATLHCHLRGRSVALTLREVCGLTTEEIARAFLVTPATLAQRIVRAKAVIRDKAIAYQVPVSQELSGRLGPYFRLCTWFSTRVIQWNQQGLD